VRTELSQSAKKPSVHRIALIPIAPPATLCIRNTNLAPSFLPVSRFQSIDDCRRNCIFDQKMEVARGALGAKLTAKLVDELESDGFEVSLLDNVRRSPRPPHTIDYRSLPTRDAVLHVAFADVGMCSSPWSKDYEPSVNASARLMADRDASDWLTTDSFYYGADSSGDTAWSIPADPKYRFPSLEAMVDNADEVAAGYDVAALALAQRIARRLRAQL
jgi:hypothetical protein